ncbi:hypothetical protein HR12_23140, partial [Microbacterium sp. SUBG005]
MNHRATGDASLLDASRTCADYFLAHLPADDVPYWDLVYGDDADAPRDSSSGAIAVCGLFELADVDRGAGALARRGGAHPASLIARYTPARARGCRHGAPAQRLRPAEER